MIIHGTRTLKLHKSGGNPAVDVIRGYYLVLPNGDRHWFSSTITERALERICNKYLTDTQFSYWVDFCHGRDVGGNLAWANVDQTDSFI